MRPDHVQSGESLSSRKLWMRSIPGRWADSSGRRDTTLLTLVLLYGLLVRLPGLGTLPIWYDEAISYWSATRSWAELWSLVPRFEMHPVFFYSLLKLWTGFGTSEFTLRLLPLFLDLLAIPLVFRSGKLLGGTACAVLAAVLFASAPLQITQSQNIRPYTLLTLASAGIVYAALLIVCRASTPLKPESAMSKATILPYAGLSFSAALLLWSHNLGILQCAVVFLFLGYLWLSGRLTKGAFIGVLLAGGIAVLLYLPNILTLYSQFDGVRKGWWLSAPSFRQLVSGTIEVLGFPIYHVNILSIVALNAAFMIPATILIANLARQGSSEYPALRQCLALLACAALGPWVIAVGVTYSIAPIFMPRTLIMCQIPTLLLFSTLVVSLGHLPVSVRTFAYGFFFSIPVFNLALFYLTDARAQDSERLSKDIAEDIGNSNAKQNPIFVISNANALSLKYYLDQNNNPYNIVPLPAAYPAPNFAMYPDGSVGTPAIEPTHLHLVARQLSKADRAWLVRRRADLYDPGNLVENFLDRQFACKIVRVGSKDKVGLTSVLYYGAHPKDCGQKQ